MMRFLLLFVLLAFQAKANPVTLYYNADWEITTKSDAVYFRVCTIGAERTTFEGKVEDFTIQNQRIMTGWYTNNKKHGEFVLYYPSGQIQAEGSFENNNRVGIWKYYFENGQLQYKVGFQFPYLDFRPMQAYDSIGTPMIVKGSGEWVHEYMWYKTPQKIIVTGKFKNEFKDGEWRCRYADGEDLYYEIYRRGKFIDGWAMVEGTKQKLYRPYENKFMLPYKFEVTEKFVYRDDAVYKDYPFLSFLAPVEVSYDTIPDGDRIFLAVEKAAQYPGGMGEFMKFVGKNLIYPKAAKRMGVEGKVFVRFIVGKDGTVTNPEIVKGISTELDKEALRIISLMPNWEPGTQNGRPVKSQFVLSIPFKLR